MAIRSSARRMMARALVPLALPLACTVMIMLGGSKPRDHSFTVTNRAAPIEFSVVLRLPDARRVSGLLASPPRRHLLSAEQFGAAFGMPAARVAAVGDRLAAAGLTVIDAPPQRTSLRVRGPAAAVERLFGVQLIEVRDAGGQRNRRALGTVRIPPDLSDAVVGLSGLDTRQTVIPFAVPRGGLKPIDAARAYDVVPLWEAGLHGEGQTVAIVSFAPFREEDVAAFDRAAGIEGAPPVERIAVAGGSTEPAGLAGLEAALDVEVIRGVAPAARILSYEIDRNPANIAVAIEQIVRDGRADIVSISGGVCNVATLQNGNPSLSAPTRTHGEGAIAAAVAAGVSIFVASGDYGAYACQQMDATDRRLAIKWPTGSPGVISVGGTLLSVREDGRYLEERGWEDVLAVGGSGGGLNPEAARPAWQQAPGVDNAASNGSRQIPDVAATADPDSGFFIVFEGKELVVGGTSAAAPFWAGIVALVRQLAEREGAGRLGFLDPLLYQLRAASPSSFHDVVRGGNLYFHATPGWDFATGLGSPDADALARAVVEALRAGG